MDHSRGAESSSCQFADHMRDIAAIYSLRDRRFHFVNAAAERILGVPRRALLDDAALSSRLIVEDDKQLASEFFEKAVREGSAEAEFRVRRHDGTECWLAARAFPAAAGDDDMRGLICEDITERKYSLSLLSESERRFSQIVENIDEVFWIVAPDGTQIHYASPTYQKIWGRPVAELYTSPFKWMQSIHAEDQARVLDMVTHHLAERPAEIHFRILRERDEVRHIRARSVPVRDLAGRVVQVVGISEDVTEQKRLEQQAEESARAQRDALVREVHHRIKNNLQGVTGMLRNYANQHREVAQPISEAIAQVQAVAIIYGLQGRPGAVRVMLDDILKEVASGIGQLMHRSIRFSSDEQYVNFGVVVSEHEAVPVALVLNEIVFNAAKHADAGAELAIDLKIDIAKERACLTVTNPGTLAGATPRTARGGSGLKLIQSLLPRRGARFELNEAGTDVVARLTLEPPIVTLKC